ncbi:MAG: M48 family metalloprotease [Planctomycetes bacterium]|nr:M48 family metalloprotease [Planctomycetota bacterium]
MIILEDILSQEIIQRLGWTLLHFIWQAAAVALILAILVRLLRKSTANLRYIIACFALALIVLLPVITIQLVPVSTPSPAIHIAPAPVTIPLPAVEMPASETIVIAEPSRPGTVNVAVSIPFKQRAVDTLEPALPYIVSGWLIGVFALSIWHLGGWTQLQRLKRRMVKQVDSILLNKLKVLTQKLKVKQTVRLMESALVQIPTVVGWLKPVILLPTSALTGLNTEQLEAIIAHELAHIKRFDYLINILQTVVEILGFYHPAVWWVSHKIRAERENCCDDMAVDISGDRVSYAGALASMEEIRAAHGKLAVAATGGNLFRRICRLLGKDSTDNTGLSWVPAATAILLIIALAIPTTLALTTKSDSLLADIKTEVPVEDDILVATALDIESPDENKAPLKAIKANLFVVEIPLDSEIDTKTLKEAEKILGAKVSLHNTKVDAILRQVAKATAVPKDGSDTNKRVTEQQLNSLVKMLDSKGYLKILMNPTIETLNGKTATIKSSQHVPLQQVIKSAPVGYIIRRLNNNGYVEVVDLIEITPHVHADGHINLQIEATINSLTKPEGIEQKPTISTREISSRVHTNAGESVIIGGLVENSPKTRDIATNTKKQAKELLIILIPTITTPPTDSKETAGTQIEAQKLFSNHKLKQLGLAVAMYADDHDDDLPESIKELKPYIRNGQDFDWLSDNVEYFDKGKSAQRNTHSIPIAYDSKPPEKADGTNVLFLDFSVRFVDTKEFKKLDLKRAEFMVIARFLAVTEDFLQNINNNADSPDEAKELLKLKSELLAAMDESKAQNPTLDDRKANIFHSILNDRNVNLLLKHKDSKVLAAPHIKCVEDKTAEINVMNKETDYIVGYTEPSSPSEKPQPKFYSVKEGIFLSVKPKLTENKNIVMQFQSEISWISGFQEKIYKGKFIYKPPIVQRTTQTTTYSTKNGQTFLLGGNKISDRHDEQDEQKDLLILITASTIDSSEQDKPAKRKNLIVTRPPKITTDIITPPTIAKSKTERQKDDEPFTLVKNKDQTIQKFFRLKYYSPSQMAKILIPLITDTGFISADENTGNLLVIDTVENLKRIELIITEYDVPKADLAVTEIFEIRNGNPVEIVELLKKLINGLHDTSSVIKPDTASVIESRNGPILLIPEPKRKWIIAKASPENMKQIGQWIEKLDTDKSKMGLDPIDRAVHEKLETIVDLSHLSPGMPFAEVVQYLEDSVDPPLQIQPIWKDLIENAEVEPATPAGLDPLPRIKLRKALEILLTSVASAELPKLTYVVDEGVILIGTAEILPSKMINQVDDISNLDETTDYTSQSFQREQEKTTSAIKSDEMQILRQQYINNDQIIKHASERITKKENELIELRQQYTPSHPEIRTNASLLRALKNALQKREKEVGKAFDDMMAKETHQANKDKVAELLDEMRKTKEPEPQPSQVQSKIDKLPDESKESTTPLEQIQKQLDELIKQQKAYKVTEPNLPLAPKVRLVSSTFVDETLIDALQSIAWMGKVNIIPDENILGTVSCTLKDVTVETALDIILAGTPYIWKKTLNYYMVIPIVEPSKIATCMESEKKLFKLGKALLIYANDYEDKYPDSLHHLSDYLKIEEYK